MKGDTIKIRLRGNNPMLVDQSAERIAELAEKHGIKTARPISLPTVKDILTKARKHRRTLDILSPTSGIVDALMRLELPDGVDIDIKLSPRRL